jgi:hypothetical protein
MIVINSLTSSFCKYVRELGWKGLGHFVLSPSAPILFGLVPLDYFNDICPLLLAIVFLMDPFELVCRKPTEKLKW